MNLLLRFEYLDQDLKKLLDVCDGGLDPATTKAGNFLVAGLGFGVWGLVLQSELAY